MPNTQAQTWPQRRWEEAFCPKCEAGSLEREHAAQLEEDMRAESAERMASVQSLLLPKMDGNAKTQTGI